MYSGWTKTQIESKQENRSFQSGDIVYSANLSVACDLIMKMTLLKVEKKSIGETSMLVKSFEVTR